MNQVGFKRKLTAILSADVIGYSRLMRDDEEATVRDLAARRVLITEIIQQHNGRVVDSPGDNILAEFASVVDAVNGAIKIQAEIKKSNTGVPEDRRMEFRIGVNLGDVIEEDERIYGDGVNIAARVEGLAAGGGIAISGAVYEQVKEKLSLGYHYLGEQEVKNISEPIRVYRLLTEPADVGKMVGGEKPKSNKLLWAAAGAIVLIILSLCTITIKNYYFRPSFEPASIEKMIFPLPEKPSIAVLPFDNMSDDPKQNYFSDGITEEIITALSKVQNLFVISRNSTFTYKDQPVKVQQVAEDLGVRFVLEGSVRRDGDKVRITAQLVDAMTGKHLWADRYERKVEDIFAVQDEITKRIITELQVKLTEGEQARILAKGTDNLAAYLKFLQARELLANFNSENIGVIRQLSEEAIDLDPDWPNAYWTLGATYLMDVFYGLTKTPDKSIEKAYELAQKMVALDEKLGFTHHGLSVIFTLKKQLEKAIEHGRLAVELTPNSSDFKQNLARILMNAGRPQESIPLYEKAIRLNPYAPSGHYSNYGYALWMMGQYDKALAVGEEAVRRGPNDIFSHILLAATYIELDRNKDARDSASEILRIKPNITLGWLAKMLPWKNKDDVNRLLGDLRIAGLPEHPPLKLPDKPSIAVLAFENMSGDPKQEYFSDGISEEIITALSKTPKLFVIARTSSFKYKGKELDIRTVGRELGVRYVLEGSVRKAKDKVRIAAQLIDAKTNNHIWAERYDRKFKDIFAIQDDITKRIITALQVELTEGEQARILAKGTDNLDAYLKTLEAVSVARRVDVNEISLMKHLSEEAIALDPEYAAPYAVIGNAHLMDLRFGVSKSPKESIEKAVGFCKKSLSLDESNLTAIGTLSFCYSTIRNHDEAIRIAEQGVAKMPGAAAAYASLGRVLVFAGRHSEAIESLKLAIRMDPYPPTYYFFHLGDAYFLKGEYEEAIIAYRKAANISPNSLLPHIGLAAVYGTQGQEAEARSEAEKILKIYPKYSLEASKKRLNYKNPEDTDRFYQGLKNAGLK